MSDIAKKKSIVVSDDQQPTLVSEVVFMMSKITKHKLNRLNYLDWSKAIYLYVRSIRMAAHLTKDLLRISFLIHLGILSFFPFLFRLLIRL